MLLGPIHGALRPLWPPGPGGGRRREAGPYPYRPIFKPGQTRVIDRVDGASGRLNSFTKAAASEPQELVHTEAHDCGTWSVASGPSGCAFAGGRRYLRPGGGREARTRRVLSATSFGSGHWCCFLAQPVICFSIERVGQGVCRGASKRWCKRRIVERWHHRSHWQ